MRSDLKVINSFTRRLKVEVPWAELEGKYEAFLKKFSRKINLPGYRKGKVPARIIRQQFGPLADSEFAEQAVAEFYSAALDEGEQDAINRADITGLHFHEGSSLEFEANFEVEPEVKLPSYRRGMKFQEIYFNHDQNDVELALEELRQQKSHLRTVETGAREGYFITADLQEVDPGGMPLVGRKSENQYLHLTNGGPFGGENLVKLEGAKAGDLRRIVLPGEDGKVQHYEVSVKQVSEQMLPDLDDAFAKLVEPSAAGLKELREHLASRIQASFDRETAKRFGRDVADYFVRQAKLEAPSSMIDTYIDNLIEDLRRQGYAEETIDRDNMVAEHQATVIWNIKWFLLRRQLIDEEKIVIEDADLDAKVETLAAADPTQGKQIKNFYRRPENRRSLREDMLSEALMERLRSYAKIKEIRKPSSELKKAS